MPARHMSTERRSDYKNPSAALYRLLAWLSPSFPIGAFSYSHGLEAAVASGAVQDRASLQTWIAAIVAQGSGRIDADILSEAHRAAKAGNLAALDAANRRGIAFRATAELALESTQQGGAFLGTWRSAWASPHPDPPPLAGEEDTGGDGSKTLLRKRRREARCDNGGRVGADFRDGVCLPAVFGMAAGEAGIALKDALLGYLHAFAANLISASLRLGLIGQTDGQCILAALEPVIAEAVAAALTRDPADFGSATFAVDLASMAHETQYSRLFRS
jgi:urease accessory protein